MQVSLQELSESYRASANDIQSHLLILRAEERQERDLEAARDLRRRIRALEPILTEARELAALTAHYYEKGYYRNVYYSF